MRANSPVILDACVLVEAAVSDLILRLAEESHVLLPKWTEAIWEETHRAWIEKLKWNSDLASSRQSAAISIFPEAMVVGYEDVMKDCNINENDRHVLAAAIHAKAVMIVSFNARHFPDAALKPWNIKAVHPAEYLCALYDHDSRAVEKALRAMARAANRSLPEILGRLAWYVMPFSQRVSEALDCDLPVISPSDWKR